MKKSINKKIAFYMVPIISFGIALLVSASPVVYARDIRLSWDSVAPGADIAAYRIYYSEASMLAAATNRGTTSAYSGTGANEGASPIEFSQSDLDLVEPTVTVSGLDNTFSYCFVVTAVNSSGLESLPSNEVCAAAPTTRAPARPDIKSWIEAGSALVDHEWVEISFSHEYDDPVVIATSLSENDSSPATVRIRNVTKTGFELHVEEWDYLDVWHRLETVGYVVIEAGRHQLDDGTQFDAGHIRTSKCGAQGSFEKVQFIPAFGRAPVVFTSAQSANGSLPVVVRNRKISTSGFEFVMQTEEAVDVTNMIEETIGYMSVEQGTGMLPDNTNYEAGFMSRVNHMWTPLISKMPTQIPLVLLLDMQTLVGPDTANVRFKELPTGGLEARIAEEQSLTQEMIHKYEKVGFFLLEKN